CFGQRALAEDGNDLARHRSADFRSISIRPPCLLSGLPFGDTHEDGRRPTPGLGLSLTLAGRGVGAGAHAADDDAGLSPGRCEAHMRPAAYVDAHPLSARD